LFQLAAPWIVGLSSTAPVGLASRPRALTIGHQFDIVDRLEQKATRQFTEPAVESAPELKMHRQHAPTATGAHQLAHPANY